MICSTHGLHPHPDDDVVDDDEADDDDINNDDDLYSAQTGCD